MSRWSDRAGVVALCVWLGVTFALVGLCLKTALDQEKGLLAIGAVAIVGVIAITSTIYLFEGRPKTHDHWRNWLQPRPIAGLFGGTFAAFGVMMSVLSPFAPTPAVESKPRTIERTTAETLAEVRKVRAAMPSDAAAGSRIRDHISRRWGTPQCEMVWSFKVVGDALVIESMKAPPGQTGSRQVATIQPSDPRNIDKLYARERGRAAEFSYTTNGVTEGLRWDDLQTPALDLVAC